MFFYTIFESNDWDSKFCFGAVNIPKQTKEKTPAAWKNELKGAFSGLRQLLATESPLKMMKNAFYFTSKLSSFSKYLRFCLN